MILARGPLSSPLRFIWCALIVWIPQVSHAAFYTEGADEWAYRAPLKVDAVAAAGSTIVFDLDFDDLIGQTTAPGTFDPNSVRIVKDDTTLIAQQEFNDAVLAGALDATGNGEGEVRFILEDAPGAVDYHVYFDITENGAKPTNPAQPINATFEQSTGAPTGWSTASVNTGGAQNNETFRTTLGTTLAVAAGCSTGGATVDNSPNSLGGNATGRGWHLLGYRDNCEDGSGNELVRLTRSIRVPAGTAAGNLNFSFQVQAWDGISNANNYDWFVIYINNTPINHLAMGVTAGSPALVLESARFGRSAFGAGLVDHGWRDATVDLSSFQNSTITLRFEARFSSADNAYRSWMKLDDISWSTATAVAGTPELDTISVASFRINHDTQGIYCLGETLTVAAVDATGTQIQDFVGTVTIDTQQSTGQFSLAAGNGAFSSSTNGTASYSFVTSDLGQATFVLNYPSGPTPIDIDVTLDSNPTIRDDDTEGTLTFSPNGFTLTANAIGNPPPSPIITAIPAQIAAIDFALHITAYGQTADDPTCGVIETYTGNKPVAFWQTYSNPASGTLQTSINSTNVANSQAAATPQTVNFVSGQAQVTAQYPDVGEIRINATDSTTGSVVISGSTENFIVKPANLVISNIESSAGLTNPAATTLTGAGFVAAGEAFVVEVDSLNANNALTPNFGRETPPEQVAVSSESLVLPIGGRNGSTGDVDNGSSFSLSATPGRQRNSIVGFDETGIISMRARLTDNDYLGAGDVSRPLVANVGRFYPANFVLASGTLTPSCTSFTYMDEPGISIDFELQALNAAGDITTNYSDALYGSSATADFQLTAENANDGIDLSARLSPLANGWTSGTLGSPSQIAFNRGITPDGPFNSLQFGARVIDTLDGQFINNATLQADTSGDCSVANTCNSAAIGLSTSVLYGRALVLPAQGPETSPLEMALETQFFNGVEFQRNTADNCTTYSATDASLANYTDNLQSGETSITSPVVATLFTGGATPAANALNLSAPGTGNTGTVDLTFDAESWLKFDWLGSGDENPTATATFGGFRGHDRIIYWQEQR